MKLKTRLIVAFITVITIPVLMTGLTLCLFGQYQIKTIEKTYGISGTTYKSFSNSMQMLNTLTEQSYKELTEVAEGNVGDLEDATFLDDFNRKLGKKNSYLLVRKDKVMVYLGARMYKARDIIDQLPNYEDINQDSGNGIYLGGKAQVLVKQVDFNYRDHAQGSAFIVTDVSGAIPEVQQFVVDMIVTVMLILVFTAALLILWIYRGVVRPLGRMQVATNNIKEGNLDFQMEAETDDEIGRLCLNFEDMRKRLKANAEEKVVYDKESKELISNISHDLKTPVTAIKGYAEGIMDGVADTPEKRDKYIRTIYNKASEMDLLINELTLYSKIDTNRIPYNFSTILVGAYFDDCAEEVSLDLEAKGVEFGYFNYVDQKTKIIADAEQIKRVVNNIITNSLKYMDKSKGLINLRVKDVGDFVQVELEDNGKGIGAKDLPNIFDRFYRTDASRNSSKGGSGIGLSIVKKIIEEHGGKIWATSREGTGTVMYFVIRKYQEVPTNG
ncbi:MAG: HAMP domain-containing sensor histidine kinase [Lachnospiraceae bacterium]